MAAFSKDEVIDMATRHRWVATVLLGACIASTSMSTAAFAADPPPVVTLARLDPTARAHLQQLVAIEVVKELERSGDAGSLRSVTFDLAENMVRLDLSSTLLPLELHYVPSNLEDRLGNVSMAVQELVSTGMGLQIGGVLYTFDGQPLSHYFPKDYPENSGSRAGR